MSPPLLLLGARTNSGVWTRFPPWARRLIVVNWPALRIWR